MTKTYEYEQILSFIKDFLHDLVTGSGGDKFNNSLAFYGYDIAVSSVIILFLQQENSINSQEASNLLQKNQDLWGLLNDILWELSLIGVLRPSVNKYQGKAVSDGGFSITNEGKEWIQNQNKELFIPFQSSSLLGVIKKLDSKFDKAFSQRAIEAIQCSQNGTYLAACTMAGAAAESIILKLAIEKDGNSEKILKEYKASNGRTRIKNNIIGQSYKHIKQVFENAFNLLSYWRDDAAHGEDTGISRYEALSAIIALVHFAEFVNEKWDVLTQK